MEFCFILCVLILESPDCEDRTTSVRGQSDSFPNSHVGSFGGLGSNFRSKEAFLGFEVAKFHKIHMFL